MKSKKSLSSRIILASVFAVIVLCVCTIFIGYNGFRGNILQQYHDSAYLIADTVREEISKELTADDLKHYSDVAREGSAEEIEEITGSDAYKKVKSELSSLCKTLQLNDIYVSWFSADELRAYREGDKNWKPLLYLFDCYVQEEENYLFGERSAMNHKNIELFAEVVETGHPQDKFIVSDGEFGYNISGLLPVMTEKNELAAVIGVEVPMIRVQSAVKMYIVRTVAATVLSVIAVVLLVLWVFSRKVIKPIEIIDAEVRRFGNQGIRTEETAAALLKIRTDNEIETLAGNIDKMEKDLMESAENFRRVTVEKERIGAELNVATQIQADMLPCIFPPFPNRREFDLYASMTPAKEVGGDFYDFFLLDDDHLAMVMADVSGKGVPAALFMVISKTLIKDHAKICSCPRETLEKVNNILYESNAEGMFVTVWLGIMEISTGKITAANAGHEYPAVRKADGTFELLKDKHGMMVGAMPGIPYTQYELEIEEGGCLFLYTDGVPEATNGNNELFGTDRMLEALNQDPCADPEQLLKNIKNAVDGFVGEAPQFDDLTMLALVRTENTEET